MSTATPAADLRSATRGGPLMFSPTYFRLDLRRTLRNRRTLVFLLIMPIAFFFIFKSSGGNNNASFAYVMVSMAVYGAMIATTSQGASVSVERSQGWTRQLRLTPLRPAGYVASKLLTALALAVVPIALVLGAGALSGVHLDAVTWVEVAAASWVCSLVFAAFGLFMGYLIPAENVMQFIGPLLAILSFLGGLFIPLDVFSPFFRHVAYGMPTYAVGEIARSPITHSGFTAGHVGLLVLWIAIFGTAAAALFRRDTNRV